MAGAGLLLRSFQQVIEVDPGLDAAGVLTALSESLGARRTPTVLLLGFAAVALFLAAVGTYSRRIVFGDVAAA